ADTHSTSVIENVVGTVPIRELDGLVLFVPGHRHGSAPGRSARQKCPATLARRKGVSVDRSMTQDGGRHTSQLSPRSARKRAAIEAAALEAFLRHGYVGTSMDEIAARATVSKQTLYKHVGDKRSLFIDLLTAQMAQADTQVDHLGAVIPRSNDLA